MAQGGRHITGLDTMIITGQDIIVIIGRGSIILTSGRGIILLIDMDHGGERSWNLNLHVLSMLNALNRSPIPSGYL